MSRLLLKLGTTHGFRQTLFEVNAKSLQQDMLYGDPYNKIRNPFRYITNKICYVANVPIAVDSSLPNIKRCCMRRTTRCFMFRRMTLCRWRWSCLIQSWALRVNRLHAPRIVGNNFNRKAMPKCGKVCV